MKNRYIRRVITIVAMCLALALVASAQRRSKAQGRAFPPGPSGPCHQNTRVCVQNMNRQISQLRSYVQHLKPGEKVIFNPQPDPPGIPASYRNAIRAYRSLMAEFLDLSSNSSEIAGLKGSPEKLSSAQNAIKEAQAKLEGLGNPPLGDSHASTSQALNSLGASVQRLSKTIGGW